MRNEDLRSVRAGARQANVFLGVLLFGLFCLMQAQAAVDELPALPDDDPFAPDKKADVETVEKTVRPEYLERVFRGKTILHWIQEMKQPDRNQRFHAIEVLAQAGPEAAPAIHDLIKLLSTPRFGSAAAIALGCIGSDAVEPLIPLLEHRDVWTRVCTLDALGMIGYPAGKAVPKIINCLDDRETRFSAVTALSGIGEPAIPSLKALTTSDRAMLREMAISALANAGPTALPYLRKAVRDEDLMVRLVAILALEDMGQAAKPAAPDLVSVLGDENQTIRRLARQALDAVQRPSLREMEERTARLAALEAAEAAREKERPKLTIEPPPPKKRDSPAPEPGRAIAD